MPIPTIALIIAITYGMLLIIWLIMRPLTRRKLLQKTILVQLGSNSEPISRPGSLLSQLGVLAVFMANISTLFLIFIATISPTFENLVNALRIDLPRWGSVIGSILFILNGIWGVFVLLYNPNYTPLFKRQKQQIAIVTKGPYPIIRHPRYVAEGFLNLILFLFTGIGIPLLGIIGWPAIRRQALAEESFLVTVAPNAYTTYQAVTRMFLPRWNSKTKIF